MDICCNCGETRRLAAKNKCGTCYHYERKHGRPRPQHLRRKSRGIPTPPPRRNLAYSNELGKLGLFIYEHYPKKIQDGARDGKSAADVAIELLGRYLRESRVMAWEFKRDEDRKQPGTYSVLQTIKRVTVYLACPRCCWVTQLDSLHVAPDGEIKGIVKCPGRGCDFQGKVRLLGWPPTRDVVPIAR